MNPAAAPAPPARPGPASSGGGCGSLGSGPSSPGVAAAKFACSKQGMPYVWGGNGGKGYDCSGLTDAAYKAAGVWHGARGTAQDQYNKSPRLPAGADHKPGDLLFFGDSPNNVTHVGMSLGGDRMVNAPDFGQVVKEQSIAGKPKYIGATRPAGR